jgi:hypothetical protein
MIPSRFRSEILAVILVTTWVNGVGAQEIGASLADLKGLSRGEPHVIVTNTSGQQFRGRISDASESLLSVRIGREVRQFDRAEVREVRVRREDSLVNGALIGAAAGGGATSLIFLDNECRDDPVCYAAVGIYAGIGALAGLGLDALIHRQVVVYSVPPPQRIVSMAPMMEGGRRGVRLMISF